MPTSRCAMITLRPEREPHEVGSLRMSRWRAAVVKPPRNRAGEHRPWPAFGYFSLICFPQLAVGADGRGERRGGGAPAE